MPRSFHWDTGLSFVQEMRLAYEPEGEWNRTAEQMMVNLFFWEEKS